MPNNSPQLPGRLLTLCAVLLTLAAWGRAQEPGKITVRVDHPGARIDPMFYGLMTEEINHSYDGGIYAELIRNRTFQDAEPYPPAPRPGRPGFTPAATSQPTGPSTQPDVPLHWSLVTTGGAQGRIATDLTDPVNTTGLKVSMRLDITRVGESELVGAANEGFWGIPVKPNTTYQCSFYAKGSSDFKGPLRVLIKSNDTKQVHAFATLPAIDTTWRQYKVTLKTNERSPQSTNNQFIISSSSTGSVWLSLVSLFPPTYKDRANGNRIDIMELLAGMKPAFLRFPGGNYLEGNTIAERFNWKETVGPLEQRPGHWSPWRYRSSDGMGLLEFCNWCEDLGVEPILGVFAGYALRGEKALGDDLKPHVQDALDEIEYMIGDPVTTKWGAERAKHGHPKPFKLTYVEIGNEDHLEGRGTMRTYEQRYAPFHDAIRAKFPQIKLIATMRITGRTPDLYDDHFYHSSVAQAIQRSHAYDRTPRDGPKIFVGEWATRVPFPPPGLPQPPTPNHAAAVADGAWLTGLERNADLIVMTCYAPLLVHVGPGAMQWRCNLIGYDALRSYGSPSYYVQKMFAENRGDVVLPVQVNQQPAAPTTSPTYPTTVPSETLFACASRINSTGDVILKVANAHDTPQSVRVELAGVTEVSKEATAEVLSGQPDAMNSVESPQHVVPKRVTIAGAGPSFTHEFPAWSVTVLRVKAR